MTDRRYHKEHQSPFLQSRLLPCVYTVATQDTGLNWIADRTVLHGNVIVPTLTPQYLNSIERAHESLIGPDHKTGIFQDGYGGNK